MKNKFLGRISIITLTLILFCACDFGDTNVDPSTPADTSIEAILPASQAGISWVVGGEALRFSGILLQHFQGINAQQADNTKYLIREADTNGLWFRMYEQVLGPLNVIVKKAKKIDAPHYEGVAKVLIASGVLLLTDLFGDVPYSKALQATEGVYTPVYDTQQNLYTTALPKLLDDAIALLQKAKSPGKTLTEKHDLIYRGDKGKWIKAAYSLKAKLIFQQVQQGGSSMYNAALVALRAANGISTNEDDFEMRFGTGSNEVGPFYQFLQSRSGNLKLDINFVKKIIDPVAADSRKWFFVNRKKPLSDKNMDFSGYYQKTNSPVVILSYVELKFMEAEAYLMQPTSNTAEAKRALNDAVEASFMKITGNATPTGYATRLDAKWTAATTVEDRLALLIDEKYIACYAQGIVAWNDYRRTGYPNITPNPEGSNAFNPTEGGAFRVPRRLPYPQSERLLNGENIPMKTPNLQKRIWWDQ